MLKQLTQSVGLARLFTFQVLSGILVAPLFALFPIYVERKLGLGSDFTGTLRALFVLTSAGAAAFGGALCDRHGRKPIYLLAMTGVIASGLLFLAREPWVMILLSLFAGSMFGLGSVAGLGYLMDLAPKSSLALATAVFFMTGTIGNAAGSIVSGRVALRADGYPILAWTMAIGNALLLLAAAALMPKTPVAPRSSKSGNGGGFGGLLQRPDVWALLALRFLPTCYWGCATLLMPLLLFRLTGSEAAAGTYTSLSLILSAASQVGAGRLVDAIGVRPPLIAALTLVIAASIGQSVFGGSVIALSIAGLVGACGAWSISVTMTTLVQALSDEETKSRLLGATHVAWSAGFLAGNLFAGKLDGAHGASAAFLLAAGGCMLAMGCALCVLAAVRAREAD